MAAKMSSQNFFQQQSKYGAGPSNGPAPVDVSPELHLKMSKKIAQLTKVIYALNTKNDEHEAMVQSLKEAHEEELQQLMGETKQKMMLYQSKLGKETELQQRVNKLEAEASDFERQKREAGAEFSEFKRKSEVKEGNLRAEHSQKLLSLSQDLLAVKRDFEDRLKQFDDVKARLEREKHGALEDLKSKHRDELEALQQAQNAQKMGQSSELEEINMKHAAEISRLKEECEAVNEQKTQLVEDYEGKLEKLKAFHEREISALRENELQKQGMEWKEKEEALRRTFAQKEHSLNSKVQELTAELAVSEEDLAKYKDLLTKAEAALESREGDASNLGQQLLAARKEASSAMTRLKEVEGELAASRQRCEDQASEMVKKSSLIGTLEATQLSNAATIKDLESDLSRLQDKVQWLEKERASLESSKQSLSQQQTNQLQSLEKALEDLSIEKQVQKERYERELEAAKSRGSEDIARLEKEHGSKAEEMLLAHRAELEKQQREAAEELAKLKQELEQQLESTRSQLTQERDSLQTRLTHQEAELSAKLKRAESEARRLQGILDENERGLGSANTRIGSLQQTNAQLLEDLEKAQKDGREASSQASSFKTELEKLKHTHATKMAESREELKTKLDQLSKDLDSRWTETLRKECEKLRSELTEQHDEDKQSALKQLTSLKNQELDASKQGWQKKVTELLQEISSLKERLTSKSERSLEEMAALQRKADQEINRLKFEMATAAEGHSQVLSDLKETQEKERERTLAEHRKALEDLESMLKAKYKSSTDSELEAHQEALKKLRTELDQTRLQELDMQSTEHRKAIERLRLELTQRQSAELDQLTRAHRTQMTAAKMELDRAIELKERQERDHELRSQELKEDLHHRDRHIGTLDQEVKDLRGELDKLKGEIDFKAQEVQKIKSEAVTHLRKREQALQKAHQDNLDKAAAEHLRETQAMLGEFNKAQDLLKDKISALQIMLEEAEERYQSRDSRPEDLQQISRLKDMIADKEQAIKKLIDDKRFFQMELINRETNFNKVFNANPNIGVLNPLAAGKKKRGSAGSTGSDDAQRYVSAPNLNSPGGMKGFGLTGTSSTGSSPGANARLDPLPDSPIHDIQLNPKRPLQDAALLPPRPPRTKKFINT
ncbi:protein FAM184A-like [Diadema antillarum]|uniref:protein FAM184A-like n=1 Tax=Diadema antillarum TaxID=105358 RepID=UPI003A86189D